MKKYIIIIILFLSCKLFSDEFILSQVHFEKSRFILDISNLDEYRFIIATMQLSMNGSKFEGNYKIFLTEDAGKSFVEIFNNFKNINIENKIFQIKNIAFTSDSTIYAMTDAGTCAKTTNLGKNWEIFTVQSNVDIWVNPDLKMIDDNRGICRSKSDGNHILITEDGWKTYNTINLDTSQIGMFANMYVLNDSTYYCNFKFVPILNNLLYWSNDWGKTWKKRNIYEVNFTINDMEFHFINDSVGFQVFTYYHDSSTSYLTKIYKTSDNCKSWELKYLDSVYQIPHFIKDIVFESENVGFAVGYSKMIIKTLDQGETWTKSTIEYSNFVNDNTSIPEFRSFIHFKDKWSYLLAPNSPYLLKMSKGLSVLDIQNNNYSSLIFPNPVQSSTFIKFRLDEQKLLKIDVYDNIGNSIKNIDFTYYNKGENIIEIDLSDVNSGVYLVKLQIQNGQCFYNKLVKL